LEAEANGVAGDRGLEAWLALGRDPKMQESVNRWLGHGWLDTPYRVTARPLVYADEPKVEVGPRDLQFEDVSTGVRLGHPDLGFGISQVLPVLVNAAAEPGLLRQTIGRVIAIEQPELHLHPAMQAELCESSGEFARQPRTENPAKKVCHA
jgi:predicted ATPase